MCVSRGAGKHLFSPSSPPSDDTTVTLRVHTGAIIIIMFTWTRITGLTNGLEIDRNNTCGSRAFTEQDLVVVSSLCLARSQENRSKCQLVQVEMINICIFLFLFFVVFTVCHASFAWMLACRHSRGIYLIDTHFLTHLSMFHMYFMSGLVCLVYGSVRVSARETRRCVRWLFLRYSPPCAVPVFTVDPFLSIHCVAVNSFPERRVRGRGNGGQYRYCSEGGVAVFFLDRREPGTQGDATPIKVYFVRVFLPPPLPRYLQRAKAGAPVWVYVNVSFGFISTNVPF